MAEMSSSFCQVYPGPPIQPWPQRLLDTMCLICRAVAAQCSGCSGKTPHPRWGMSTVGLHSYPGAPLSPWTPFPSRNLEGKKR